jgi:hypothetical protein
VPCAMRHSGGGPAWTSEASRPPYQPRAGPTGPPHTGRRDGQKLPLSLSDVGPHGRPCTPGRSNRIGDTRQAGGTGRHQTESRTTPSYDPLDILATILEATGADAYRLDTSTPRLNARCGRVRPTEAGCHRQQLPDAVRGLSSRRDEPGVVRRSPTCPGGAPLPRRLDVVALCHRGIVMTFSETLSQSLAGRSKMRNRLDL